MSKIRDLLNDKAQRSMPPQRPAQRHQEIRDNSFDDDQESNTKNIKGLKLTNEKSSVKVPRPQVNVKAMRDKILSDKKYKDEVGWNFAKAFLATMKNKTLAENKDPNEKEGEDKLLLQYIEFARIVNNDEGEEECLGAMAIITMLLRGLLIQRDRMNELEYTVKDLKRQVKTLEEQKKKE